MLPENNSDNGDSSPSQSSSPSPTGVTDVTSPTIIAPSLPNRSSDIDAMSTPAASAPTPEPVVDVTPPQPVNEPVQPPTVESVSPETAPEAPQETPTTQQIDEPVSPMTTDPIIPSSGNPSMPLMQAQAPHTINEIPKEPPKQKKKSGLKVVLILLVCLLLVGMVAGAYVLGKRSAPKQETPTVTAKPITLPPEAIVTAECVPGRGKQYIIPKDIPIGPIYDVNNGRVIAIEYNLPIVELLSNPDTFSDTLNKLMKNYSTDHFTLVPSPPKPGEQVSEVHLIMFVVPKEEAATITCGLTPEQLQQLSAGAAGQQTAPTETN